MFRRTPYPLKSDQPPRTSITVRLIGWVGIVYLAVVGFAQLAGFVWPADLLINFTLQFVFAGLLLLVVLLVSRRWKLAGLVALAVVLQFIPLYAVWGNGEPLPGTSVAGDDLVIVQHNISHFNNDRAATVNTLIQESAKADIVILFEVAPRWMWFLRPLQGLFPNHLIEPQLRSFGFAVFTHSKDITIEKVTLYSGYSVAVIHGKTRGKHIPYTVYAVHTPSPYNLTRWTDRNTMLLELSHLIAQDKTKAHILIGDLNTTPFSALVFAPARGCRTGAAAPKPRADGNLAGLAACAAAYSAGPPAGIARNRDRFGAAFLLRLRSSNDPLGLPPAPD